MEGKYEGLQGLQQLNEMLLSLPQKAHYNVLRNALLAGAKVIAKRAVARASAQSVQTGRMVKSIRAKRSRSKKGEVAAAVAVEVPYAHLVEYGFNHTNGNHVPGKPFLFPAFQEKKHEIEEEIVRKLKELVSKELSGAKFAPGIKKTLKSMK